MPSKPAADGKSHKAVNPWVMLFTDPMAYKPLIIVNALFIIQQIVGIYITIYFAVPLFKVRILRRRFFYDCRRHLDRVPALCRRREARSTPT